MQGKISALKSLLIFLFVLSLSSCLKNCPPVEPPPPPPPPAKGFQCLSAPSEWNEPGSLFYVNKNGEAHRVGKVTGIEGKPGVAVIPSHSYTRKVNIGLMVNTLEEFTGSTGWSGQLGIAAGADLTARFAYSDILHYITEEPKVGLVSKWFNESYSLKDQVKYYLVRESYAAKSIDYEIKSADMIKLGGSAQFKKAAEGKLDVLEIKANDTWAIKATLPKHVNVCFKAQQQELKPSASGVTLFNAGKFVDNIEINKIITP